MIKQLRTNVNVQSNLVPNGIIADKVKRVYLISDEAKTFLLYVSEIQSAAFVTTLIFWLVYRGSWMNKGFLLLSASSVSSTVSTVTGSFIVWSHEICQQPYYQATYIMWRIKDFSLHTYIMVRTNALTSKQFSTFLNTNILLWLLFNLFRLVSLFTCWNKNISEYFNSVQPILESIESVWLFCIDLGCALLLFVYYIRNNFYRTRYKPALTRLTFYSSNWIFFIVLFISIPAYIFYILETFAYFDSSVVSFFIFEENITTTLLTAEFLNISNYDFFRTNHIMTDNSIPSQTNNAKTSSAE